MLAGSGLLRVAVTQSLPSTLFEGSGPDFQAEEFKICARLRLLTRLLVSRGGSSCRTLMLSNPSCDLDFVPCGLKLFDDVRLSSASFDHMQSSAVACCCRCLCSKRWPAPLPAATLPPTLELRVPLPATHAECSLADLAGNLHRLSLPLEAGDLH